MNKILIIQTAFIGDVILATSLIEAVWHQVPDTKIDFLVRKGNEQLLYHHPYVNEVLVWNKKKDKYKNLIELLGKIRKTKYQKVITIQRFATSGFLTAFSGARETIGFNKNPFSFFFSKKIKHAIQNNEHEIDRNHQLIAHFAPNRYLPKLYPTEHHKNIVEPLQKTPYVCMAPSSVWFTKQLPTEKWIKLIEKIPSTLKIYLLGAKEDYELCETILEKANHPSIENLCGKLNLLESAALIEKAKMNYVNDSAPLHLASAMDAPTTAFFCSTIPQFGFGPLARHAIIVETQENLTCRPCGLHGFQKCPEGHFKCAYTIDIKNLITTN